MATKKIVKKAAIKKVKKKTKKEIQKSEGNTELFEITAKPPPCVCEKKRKFWFCMKILPNGSKVQCLGPFATKEDCEAEKDLCDI